MKGGRRAAAISVAIAVTAYCQAGEFEVQPSSHTVETTFTTPNLLLLSIEIPLIRVLEKWPGGFAHHNGNIWSQDSKFGGTALQKGFQTLGHGAKETAGPATPKGKTSSKETIKEALNDPGHPLVTAADFEYYRLHCVGPGHIFDAKKAIKVGQLDAAIDLLLTPDPYWPVPADPGVLADCYWLKGRPDLAYAVMSKAAQGYSPSPTGEDVDFWIRASVAAAQNGEVFVGQRHYLINYLRQVNPFIDPDSLPAGSDQKSILILSYLALMTASSYSDEVVVAVWASKQILDLDPGNPAAATTYMGEMDRQCHRKELERVYFTTLNRGNAKTKAIFKHYYTDSQFERAHPAQDRNLSDLYDLWPDLK